MVCEVSLIGAFAKLRRATISFIMSVRLSLRLSFCPHGTPRPHWTDFGWIWYLRIYQKSA